MEEELQKPRPQLIIRVYDPNFGPTDLENTAGMVFPLKEDGKLQEDLVDVFIAKIDAAPLPDSRSTIVTALLRNDFIITEAVCTADSKEEYDFQRDIEKGVERIKEKVQEHLKFMMACGNIKASRIIEIDNISREQQS